MLLVVAALLVVLWGVGLVTHVAAGGLIHVLLVVAAIVLLVKFIGGRNGRR